MTSFIDKKYINLVSGQLERFKWKSATLANCRCPICGDSQKNRTKCRGYFYEKSNSFFYRCHNCGFGSSIKNFLDRVCPSLLNEYTVETFNESFTPRKKKKEVKMDFRPFASKKVGKVKAQELSLLPDEHPCKKFVAERKIPEKWHKKLFYTDNFNNFVSILIDDSVSYPEEERLVIPFTDKDNNVYAAQGRRIVDGETPKYFTAKPKEEEKLWFNLWDVDVNKPVMIVEGPIDSMFLSNAVAMVGSGAITDLPERLQDAEIIYVLDNEPRNKQIVSYYKKLIDSDKKICIWPSSVKCKDVNDMILNGMDSEEVEELIAQNSFSNLEASLKFNNWRKV